MLTLPFAGIAQPADGVTPPAAANHADGADDFTTSVAPIFARRCLGCHNERQPKGGLNLQSAAALRGGDSGPVIEPGDPDSSYLLDLIVPSRPAGGVGPGKAAMPKDADPLSEAEVAAIRRWIARGARWPRDFVVQEARVDNADWWSWRELTSPPLPELKPEERAWVRTPVDAFIVARLRKEGLRPSPEADRRTLIRRLSFDLLGLPPSPEEVESFVRDERPLAYERLVERFLASPHYGQRWARHWLDVVHYGDSHGYDKDKPRNHAWPYRDYVVRALNDDRPYERFILEQLAGDVLFPDTVDGLTAGGFLAAGPWDFISHVEVPESKIDGQVARSLDRDDFVRTVMESFCSVTIGCARCHHHKFDPVTQEDYYALQAVFAAVDRAERPFDADSDVARRRATLLAQQQKLQQERDAIEAAATQAIAAPLAALDRQMAALPKAGDGERPEFGYHSAIEREPSKTKWVQVDLGRSYALTKLTYVGCHDNFNGIGAGFGFPLRYKIELSDSPDFAGPKIVLLDATGQDVVNPGVEPQVLLLSGQRGRYLRFTAVKLAPRKNDYMFALAELQAFAGESGNVAAGAHVTALDSIEAPVRWQRKNLVDGYYYGALRDPASQEQLAVLQRQRRALLENARSAQQRARLAAIEEELSVATGELRTLPPQQRVYAAVSDFPPAGNFIPTRGKPREIRLLHRGNVLTPGEAAAPGALEAIAALPGRFQLSDTADEGQRRVALARWVADRRNPLTWRSIVNRAWLYHFGAAIADSPNDLGRMGRPPTHPELLDYLAAEFRDGRQSLKDLHRTICNSATYRQTSDPPPAAHAGLAVDPRQVDAGNRWLWKMNRRRLEAEAIRDAVLVACDKLDQRMGGPGFQDFVIEKPEHSPHYQYHLHDPNDPRSHRRAIYRFAVRSQQQPFMTVLDCADPSMQVEKRNETLTALQALSLLNNPFMLAMSRQLAERAVAEHAGGDLTDLREPIRTAWRRALSREPDEHELAALTDYARQHGLPNACRMIFNLSEFVFVD